MITDKSNLINVFDLDGTIIKCNSFKKVNKSFLFYILTRAKLIAILHVSFLIIIRKLNIISHFKFKQHISICYEKYLSENVKHDIVQKVYTKNLNQQIFSLMLNSKPLIISTAAPYFYASRINFNLEVDYLITALHPSDKYPNKANYQQGKIENIKNVLGNEIIINAFYTDNLKEDWPLANIATDAFLVDKNNIIKISEDQIKLYAKSKNRSLF